MQNILIINHFNRFAIHKLRIVEHVYLADNEKNYYKEVRSLNSKLEEDKVKLARIQYRGKGKYIDEILC